MPGYQCPLCGRQMDRDLVLFLDHTNQHVIDRIKLTHPEWITENGVCKPCVAYYENQISGDGGNLGPSERRKRLLMGFVCLCLSVAGEFYLTINGFPRAARLALFAPLFFTMFGFIQAQEKTCAVLAVMESQHMDSGVENIKNAAAAQNLKRKGHQIIFKSAVAAACVTLLFFFLP